MEVSRKIGPCKRVQGKTNLGQGIANMRQEVKAEINTALNRLMLYFTALAAALALLTLFAC
ncbi:hypothetical protein Thermus77420_01850 [Thermus thalpophilus]